MFALSKVWKIKDTNMADNSDYKKVRSKLHEMLPDVYQSDTSKSIFENLFNRFLTKAETERVAGYIGDGSKNAITKRQIQEPDVHRQGWQLQPILYDKIGSVEHMSSWKDILVELEQLGIDTERFSTWGKVEQFNWIPPIDISKLVHYQDYYWYDEDNPSSKPEYITIRSRCATATANVNSWQSIIERNGSTFEIVDVRSDNGELDEYLIHKVDHITSEVVLSGDFTPRFKDGDYFSIKNSPGNVNTGEYLTTADPSYDVIANETTLTVAAGSFTVTEDDLSTIVIQEFNKIAVLDDYTTLFETGFVFYVKDSTNTDLNSGFWKVVDSVYDRDDEYTIIEITDTFTHSIADGYASLEEELNFRLLEKGCQCGGSVGWDMLPWDDNPSDPLWDGDYDNFLTQVSNPAGPDEAPNNGAGTDKDVWYDTTADKLYQYGDDTGWVLEYNNFSLILEQTVGIDLWDFMDGCGISSKIAAADQWVETNKWLHKQDVPNFSIARRAQLPIIEYDWDLELNEWTYTDFVWKYRKTKYDIWTLTDATPTLFDLTPIDIWEQDGEHMVFSERYGDLTKIMYPGYEFQYEATLFEVKDSFMKSPNEGEPLRTYVELTVPITGSTLLPGDVDTATPSSTQIRPHRTAAGDAWRAYHEHWLYVERNDTLPVVHQPINMLIDPEIGTEATEDPSGDFKYTIAYYSQRWTMLATGYDTFELSAAAMVSTSRNLRRRALVGSDDTRVYVNNVRQFGNYDELAETASETDLVTGIARDVDYVRGITFHVGTTIDKYDEVRIEVGEAASNELGTYAVPVRTIESDVTFASTGPVSISLVTHKKVEQVKAKLNQYPLFDIYKLDGSPAYQASSIFGYRVSSDEPVNPAVGLRIVYDESTNIFEFDQFILGEDDGMLFAFRDYSRLVNTYWVDPQQLTVKFWDGLTWVNKTDIGAYYLPAHVGPNEPTTLYKSIDGVYWYDTATDVLKVRNVIGNAWSEVQNVTYSRESDETLLTIWRNGLNKETYTPEKVDWERRSEIEYDEEQATYVESRVTDLLNADENMTEAEAIDIAEEEWFTSQQNKHSADGTWVGDWEIPDPLYHNHMHENRKHINSRELLAHFGSIIEEQDPVPGHSGTKRHMFHLIPSSQVDYGLGGRIKEYNDGFDTFLSSIFVDNVTPRSLVEFAHDQYESLLNSLSETLLKNSTELLTNTSLTSLIDQDSFIYEELTENVSENDNLSLVYGDSTSGVLNWIATLPYVYLALKFLPNILTDGEDFVELVHHDGHIATYGFTTTELSGIIRDLLDEIDSRSHWPTIHDDPIDTFGRVSVNLPPNTITEFESNFLTDIYNRSGVYWYTVQGVDRVLYRLTLASIGVEEPSFSLPDGTLWLDMRVGSEVLRIKVTDEITEVTDWEIVDGLSAGDGRLHNGTNPIDLTTATVTAWQEVNINQLLVEAIYRTEVELYNGAPSDPVFLNYDFDALQEEEPILYETYSEDTFLDYVIQRDLVAPYTNDTYVSTDPFTWNYKRSIIGSSYEILEADSSSDTFVLAGNLVTVFDPCSSSAPGYLQCPSVVTFKIKGSEYNSGTWNTIEATSTVPAATYDIGSNRTVIHVDAAVVDSVDGVVYMGGLPSSANTGAEAAADWRSLYRHVYGTSYPHLEPWKLQGYKDKPAWWDTEYLNDDPTTWGTRKWKYKHGFEVIAVDAIANSFTVAGDFTTVFVNGSLSTMDQSVGVHDGVYNITSNTYDSALNATEIFVAEDVLASLVEGRFIPHINSFPSGYGMWENIRIGVIPAGEEYSNKVISVTGIPSLDRSSYGLIVPEVPTYSYFSVNIDNVDATADGGATVYSPDDVFPPYWNHTIQYGGSLTAIDRQVRTLYSNYNVEIISPGADFEFGDDGLTEWEWKVSSQYLYDKLTVAFRIDPVRYVNSTFGVDRIEVGDLFLDDEKDNTFSHSRTNFHGEVVEDALYQVDGLNQWYVNYNRFTGFDTNYSDFRSQWTLWTAPMMYQMATFVDTPSFQISHRFIGVSGFDLDIRSKRSPGVEDYWLDAFDVSLLYAPPKLSRYDNQSDWLFELNTNMPRSRSIAYYDVRNYQYGIVDGTTCMIDTHAIVQADDYNNSFSIGGNQTTVAIAGRTFDVTGSTSNNGTYTIDSVVYDSVSDATIITVTVNISHVADGWISINYREIPWETGQLVDISTDETLAIPLEADKQYYVTVIDYRTFKLALTKIDAETGVYISFDTTGRRNQYVGEVHSQFTALDGFRTPTQWRHYVIDKDNTLEFSTPHDIRGIQTIVNIVDGYDVYGREGGWRINESNRLVDPTLDGRIIGWQLELERFITFAYSSRLDSSRIPERFDVLVDEPTNVWTYSNETPAFLTGDRVSIRSNNNLYPEPIVSGLIYYYIYTSATTFQLATSKRNAETGIVVDITSIPGGMGQLSISPAIKSRESRPHHEINPFRHGVWFRPSRGIVSDTLDGPFEGVGNIRSLFDQYGRPLTRDNIRIYREDKITEISVIENIINDVELTSIELNPYGAIHLGGAHLFIDTYEHVVKFNNYTTGDCLLYDPFMGLNLTKFELLFNRQIEFTHRPNVGGQYYSTYFNQGAELKRNIEATVEDLRYAYDTYTTFESNIFTNESRDSLGYEGERSYLDDLNINQKSQFVFWRGQIQHKGSTNAVNAFINSRRFVDAKVDEFWAVKIAEYGSSEERKYPEMYLASLDTHLSDQVRLEFIDSDGYYIPEGEDVPVPLVDDKFTPISLNDTDRWFDQPDQVKELKENNSSLYFDLKPTQKLVVTVADMLAIVSSDSLSTIIIAGDYVSVYPIGSTIGVLGSVTGNTHQVVSATYSIGNDETTIVTNAAAIAATGTVTDSGVVITNPDVGWIWEAAPDAWQLFHAQDGEWKSHGTWTSIEQPIMRHNFMSDEIVITAEYKDYVSLNRQHAATRFFAQDTNTLTFYVWDEVQAYLDTVAANWAPIVPDYSGDRQQMITNIQNEIYIPAEHDYWYEPTTNTLYQARLDGDADVPGIDENRDEWIALDITFRDVIPPVATPADLITMSDGTTLQLPYGYAPKSNQLYVFQNSAITTALIEVGITYSDTLTSTQEVAVGDYYDVHYATSLLVEGSHYEKITSNIAYLLTDGGIELPDIKTLTIWGLITDQPALNPLSIVDKASRTVTTTIQMWDPARDFHMHNAIHNVDIQNDVDVAVYTDSFVPRVVSPGTDFSIIQQDSWNSNQIGTTWLDDSLMNYKPYYDVDIMPDFDDRLSTWGTLSDWGTFKVYEWVESDVLPTEWDGIAVAEEGDSSIDESLRKAGRVKQNLFYRSRDSEEFTTDFTTNTLTTTTTLVSDDDTVILSSDGVVPTPLVAGSSYTVTNTVGNSFELVGITLLDDGTGTHRFAKPFTLNWAREKVVVETLDVPIDATGTVTGGDGVVTATFQTTQFDDATIVNLYVDGKLNESDYVVPIGGVVDVIGVNDNSRVDVVKPYHVVTTEELLFDPDTADDGTIDMQWFSDYDYSTVTYHNNFGAERTRYYFWVEDKGTRSSDNRTLSPSDTESEMQTITVPYVFFQKVLPIKPVTVDGLTVEIPIRHVQVIIRGLYGIINADRRYVLRFTRDFALRDTLDTGDTPLSLKNIHEEWLMFRQEQMYHVDISLWNKITESMIGYLLTDDTQRVPALDRELYDTKYGTETQYGLESGQAFTDGALAIDTINTYLTDPRYDFHPIDVNVFYDRFNFDTPENIIDAMRAIYYSFTYTHVNRMYFSVLHDAFSLKKKYAGIMKTSMVALHGIKPFDVGGIFDD